LGGGGAWRFARRDGGETLSTRVHRLAKERGKGREVARHRSDGRQDVRLNLRVFGQGDRGVLRPRI